MKAFVFIFVLFCSTVLNAEVKERFNLNFQFFVDGVEKIVPDLKVDDGQTARVVHTDPKSSIKTILEITPKTTDIGNGEKILLDMMVKKQIAGKDHVVSRPKVVTRIGEPAIITQTNEANQGIKLIVNPSRL